MEIDDESSSREPHLINCREDRKSKTWGGGGGGGGVLIFDQEKRQLPFSSHVI